MPGLPQTTTQQIVAGLRQALFALIGLAGAALVAKINDDAWETHHA